MSIPGRTRSRRSPARKARAPGRPAGGRSDQRESLLDAGQWVFSATGFAGSSLRQIASDARVTPALAHYYFSDKAGLLEAVVNDRVAPLAQQIATQVTAAGPDPAAGIAAFVRTYTSVAVNHPWLPRLLVREVLSEQGVLRETFVLRFAGGMTNLLKDLIVRGQKAGVFRKDVVPAQAVLSLMSLCILPFIAAPLVTGALGIEIKPGTASALADHHLKIFMAGIGA